jgi:hypothetical protein
LDLGGRPGRLTQSVTDWIWSTAFYSSALLALAGAIGVVWPLGWLHRKSRRRALAMSVAGIAAIIAMARLTPSPHSSEATGGIDEFAPVFHFREHHSIVVSATPERVYAAIKTVTADDIALFNLFTSIRRFGRPGPESILNAPGQQPILDVATRTGFLPLLDRPPSEIVVGAVVVAPPGTRGRATFTVDDFKSLTQPGFAKAAMNFRINDMGGGRSRVETETRVYATDDVALGRFTPYWRIVFPGSAILRMTWLRAIKTKAEKVAS